MYLNKAFIIGNLTRDPELKALPSGIKVCSFGVATNRVWRDKEGNKQESTEFHNIVVFGRQAETTAQYLKKGSSVLVEGRLQTRSWDAQDGQKNIARKSSPTACNSASARRAERLRRGIRQAVQIKLRRKKRHWTR